jgi:hypothetical protein
VPDATMTNILMMLWVFHVDLTKRMVQGQQTLLLEQTIAPVQEEGVVPYPPRPQQEDKVLLLVVLVLLVNVVVGVKGAKENVVVLHVVLFVNCCQQLQDKKRDADEDVPH